MEKNLKIETLRFEKVDGWFCGLYIRHNRARGMHNLELMTEIVTELVKSGMSDKWIMRNIGMDKNELLRFKQISGLAELFRDKEFGWSDDWSEED